MWEPLSASLRARYPSLAGRHVVISGGASGIGAALAMAFAAQQARVTVLDIDDSAASALGERLPDLRYRHCDLTDIDSLRAALRALEREAPIDVLISNAADDRRQAFFEIEPADWDRSQAINLRAHFFAAQAAAHGMRERGRGTIINLGSVAWMRGNPAMSGYTTAKAGIHGLTRTLARELGPHGIRVNSLVPGAVVTDKQQRLWRTPEQDAEFLALQALGFRLLPDDIAAMAMFLAADDSRGCTAQAFVVDAGLTVH
ncbi:SDR family oxidoreductase [Halomonas sp. McH1-25]|uniref:SDR family NAD(P)-dependent oxidoreductase n=1 Tax=unclassified Halomonas TaxID=2609666 RepID=UPI001EF4AA46|nr:MULTISPECIES: SDR family oxidoreductase [unclassified Halomonas]MCG7599680.1 SDR family oxidoreductase [Halomonas sp. McH1-25]MCP1344342.1 SDR family oxidoreductase [Halomonas sp. FL8]MCP1362130.1 SDR family oxidoreductase [Halomonas sp. BBD45]MCP1365146.1 SDR family oxidoreductase [Halomonas sp. BBD48]